MSTERIEQEIQSTYVRLKQAAADTQYWHARYVDEIRARYQERLREIEVAYQAPLNDVPGAAETASDAARQDAEQPLGGMCSAFRWVVSDWDDPVWQDYAAQPDAPIPSAVRVGRVQMPDGADLGDVPALVAWLGKGHLFLSGDANAARRIAQTILLRLLVSFPPNALRLALADPVGLGTNLSAFLRLPDTLRGDKVCSHPAEIEEQLDALAKHIETVNQSRLQNLYPTIEAYNDQMGEIAVPYYVLALNDFPAGFDDRMAERLLQIARNGPRAGVYLVATLNRDHTLSRDFNLSDLTALGTVLNVPASHQLTCDDPEFGQYPIVPDTLPAPERMNELLAAIGQAVPQTATALAFGRVAIPVPERWKGNAADGLRVAVGVTSPGEFHSLDLGKGVAHHGLIGGLPQSGKTDLLHVLITQLALRYAPEELELYLVDFKEGGQFQDYVRLPHARVVALECEREFGLSVLRRLQDELETRGRVFKQAGITRLVDYRRQTGQTLSRVVAILDEFQVLFGEEDRLSQEAGRLLEDITWRGASFGIHVLLSSQSPSAAGMYGNRIYNQVGLRIALRCRAQDAQAILGKGNAAANRLERPGEAIYNDAMGRQEKNVFIRVAFLSSQERRGYFDAITLLAQGKQYASPITFEGRAPARLAANVAFQTLLREPGWPARSSSARVWLGEPIEIKPPTGATLERSARSNLLIAGGNDAQGYGLLASALLSLLAQRGPDSARFIIADFARPEAPFASLFARIARPEAPFTNLFARIVKDLAHPVEIAGPRQVGAALTQLIALLTQRQSDAQGPDVYFLIVGLQRWHELRGVDAYQQSEPAKQLTRLAEEGPELGIHLIAWADGTATLERVFKRGGIGNFDLRAVLRLPEKDSNDLLGSNAAARLEDNRAFFRNENWELGRMEKFKPYPAPEKDALAQWLKVMGRKTIA